MAEISVWKHLKPENNQDSKLQMIMLNANYVS